ncbi:MAG: AraC family transcriptional regulator, partial [Myxococcota bacterium]|nr:AraC family transcriptional regulator [Myxococcota bacterium]
MVICGVWRRARARAGPDRTPSWARPDALAILAALTGSIRIDAVERIVVTAASAGIDVRELLADARVSLGVLGARDDGRMSVERLHAIWRRVAGHARGRGLTVDVATHTQLEDLGPFGFSILTAPTALDALRTATRDYVVINDDGRWSIEVGPRRVTARWARSRRPDAGVVASNESIVAHFVLGMRQAMGGDLAIEEIRFAHSAPRHARQVMETLRAPVVFDALDTAIVLARAPLDDVPRLASPKLHAYFMPIVAAEIAALQRQRTFADRVRDAIAAHPSGTGGDVIAASFGITERTLRRRLAEHRTSFRALAEEQRASMALERIAHGGEPLSRIAYELGFSDASAFGRAFRRWHGTTPAG